MQTKNSAGTTDILDQKSDAKIALQTRVGWAPEPKRPMLCLPTGLSEKLGGEMLKELMAGLLSLPIEIVILGKGSAALGEYVSGVAKENSHRVALVANDDEQIRDMLKASDMALFLSDVDGMPELDLCLRHAVVPVCLTTKQIKNYDQNQESGEGFLYDKQTVWHCFAAVVRALETYRFPFDWKTIQKHCLEAAR